MPLSCLALAHFDHDKYVVACNSLSAFWYVWIPPGHTEVFMSKRLPVAQSQEDRQKLEDLFDWASRTDPGAIIRYRHMKEAWDRRRPGQTMVVIEAGKLKVDTACAA